MGLTKENFYSKKKVKVVSSWDDGGEGDIRVATMLKKYNIPGIFYVVVDWVGRDGYLTWDQIKKLDSEGFEIGSHTVHHPHDLKDLHDEDLFLEIQNSKDMIEAVLGHSISSLCYPRGRYNDRVRQAVIDAGYANARTTGTPGIVKITDHYALPGNLHIFQRQEYGTKSVLEYAQVLIENIKEGEYLNIWGHSKEVSDNRLWETLEKVFQYVNEKIEIER